MYASRAFVINILEILFEFLTLVYNVEVTAVDSTYCLIDSNDIAMTTNVYNLSK